MTENIISADYTVDSETAEVKTNRFAKIKSFATSPTAMITAPVVVLAIVAIVKSTRTPLEIDSEDI